jgi:ribosomal protein L11 methyltransferase
MGKGVEWLQVTVLTTTEGSEIVSAHLIEAGSAGTLIEDKRDVRIHQRPAGQWDIIDENILLNMSDEVKVTGYYPADARLNDALADIGARLARLRSAELPFDMGSLDMRVQSIDEEDWAESWKRQYTPFRLGAHMVVRPSWTRFDAREGDKIIEIDPGMAFGTGTHETTAMCVELVEAYLRPGARVIDVGTGTGILAIAAALNGASDVLAIDIDPVAVRVAARNVAINGFETVIRVAEGDLLDAAGEAADAVVMNIIADVIIAMAKSVRAHIKPGGAFICSGIARERKGEVIRALEDAGYAEIDVRVLGEWAAIACRSDA